MILVVLFVLRKLEKSPQWHLDFFFLGVGFSLMESAAIVRLALAFGTTWVVSAVVFAAVLLTVFLANYLIELRPDIPAAVGLDPAAGCPGFQFLLSRWKRCCCSPFRCGCWRREL